MITFYLGTKAERAADKCRGKSLSFAPGQRKRPMRGRWAFALNPNPTLIALSLGVFFVPVDSLPVADDLTSILICQGECSMRNVRVFVGAVCAWGGWDHLATGRTHAVFGRAPEMWLWTSNYFAFVRFGQHKICSQSPSTGRLQMRFCTLATEIVMSHKTE